MGRRQQRRSRPQGAPVGVGFCYRNGRRYALGIVRHWGAFTDYQSELVDREPLRAVAEIKRGLEEVRRNKPSPGVGIDPRRPARVSNAVAWKGDLLPLPRRTLHLRGTRRTPRRHRYPGYSVLATKQ